MRPSLPFPDARAQPCAAKVRARSMLTAAQLPRLTLQWAFGFAEATSCAPQIHWRAHFARPRGAARKPIFVVQPTQNRPRDHLSVVGEALTVRSGGVRAPDPPEDSEVAAASRRSQQWLLPPGIRIGPYEIVSPLGAGGMGQVYRARDTRLGRDVALKILRRTSPRSGRGARFEQEAVRGGAESSQHPRVYDVGAKAGLVHCVRTVEGESLRAVLDRGRVPLARLLDIAVQIADGLAARTPRASSIAISSPPNMMVTADGRVKILDFGLAKHPRGRRIG